MTTAVNLSAPFAPAAHSTPGEPGGLTPEAQIADLEKSIARTQRICERTEAQIREVKADRSIKYSARKKEIARLEGWVSSHCRTISDLNRRILTIQERERAKIETPLQTLARAVEKRNLRKMGDLLKSLEAHELAGRCWKAAEYSAGGRSHGFPCPDEMVIDDVMNWIASEEDNS